MDETITMIIAGDGTIEMETSNFQGSVCANVTNQILIALNGCALSEKKKAEYWDDFNATVRIQQQN